MPQAWVFWRRFAFRALEKDNRLKVLFLNQKAHYIFTEKPVVLAYIEYDIELMSNVGIALPGSSKFEFNIIERIANEQCKGGPI